MPGVHWEHAYEHGDVKLPIALPWMHELGWPFTDVRLLVALKKLFIDVPAALGYQLPEVALSIDFSTSTAALLEAQVVYLGWLEKVSRLL